MERDSTGQTLCEQGCGKIATVYGGGRLAGDWAGKYCEPCCKRLGFDVWDILANDEHDTPTIASPSGF